MVTIRKSTYENLSDYIVRSCDEDDPYTVDQEIFDTNSRFTSTDLINFINLKVK